MVSVGSVSLSNGVKLPLLGYGTWLATDPEQLKTALRTALDAGYRYFDTALVYRNENVVGDVLKEYIDAGKVKRSDLFITTKLPFMAHAPADAEVVIQRSLANLRTDYIDLYLIHTPVPFKPTADLNGPALDEDGHFAVQDTPFIDTWQVLEKHYKAGTFKAIGVSNFNTVQLRALYDQAEVKPQNIQVELHLLYQQPKLRQLCQELGITVTSYSTLGNPGRGAGISKEWVEGDCLNHPLTLELAKKYNKTSAQILLKHLVQHNISVIPKSVTPSRIQENINIFDFELSAEDLKKLDDANENTKLLVFDFAYHHPNYPFKQE